MSYPELGILVGRTLTGATRNGDAILFHEGERLWQLHHQQDCCESVTLVDLCGDLEDLVGATLSMAEVTTGEMPSEDYGGAAMWTFYRFATAKGYVTLRWEGESNGYYGVGVTFEEMD